MLLIGLVVMDVDDPGGAAEAARRHACTPFDCVVGRQECALDVAAALAEEVGVPGSPPEPVRLTRDRLAIRAHRTAAGRPKPSFAAPAGTALPHVDMLPVPGVEPTPPRSLNDLLPLSARAPLETW